MATIDRGAEILEGVVEVDEKLDETGIQYNSLQDDGMHGSVQFND